MKFRDIPQLPRAHYEVTVPWRYLERWISGLKEDHTQVEINQDYQREHVWSTKQQQAYVEYCLMGGEVARALVWNAPKWPDSTVIELVDGKQRLTAVRKFLNNDLRVFGGLYQEYEDTLDNVSHVFSMRVCSLDTRCEVLRLYLNINAGGTPHTDDELNRVRRLLEREER